MISSGDIYKVISAMAPLYLPLGLGYASVKWWRMFKSEQCDTINRLTCYFIFPFFTFDFVSHFNPYRMNYRFIAADVISKLIIGLVLVLWANCSPNGSFSWSITSFSLSTLNNTLLIGVPLLKAMYDQLGADLAVQSYVIQSVLWFPSLLFMFEFWHARKITLDNADGIARDLEENTTRSNTINSTPVVARQTESFWSFMKIVPIKVIVNPNCYTCIIGLIWALLANRWHFEMPNILEGSILTMSKAGIGVSMFNMGLFMALQEKVISCGVSLTLFGMVLRFIAGPATIGIGSVIVGLKGDVLKITIIQAALPQAVSTFVYAKEYGLHTNVISTAVIFGTIVSLPVLIAYYAIMELLH